MQLAFTGRIGRLRESFAWLLVLAVFVVSGVQVAHFDGDRSLGKHGVTVVQNDDGLCPICYSVPVGHGTSPAVISPVQLQASLFDDLVLAPSQGVQPESHLHIRPPPSVA